MNTKRSKGKAPSRFSKAQLHFALFNLWQIYFVHNRNEDATIEYFVYLASFTSASGMPLHDPSRPSHEKIYTEWKTYQNIRDLRGFFKGSWRASKPLTLAKYVFNVSDTIWEPTFWQRTWKKNEASVGYAITIRSKLWRHRQSSSISSHRYLSF